MPTFNKVTSSQELVDGACYGTQSKAATILVLLETYRPGYKAGGPITSIENLVQALGREFHFRIVTLDRDFGDRSPFPNIVVKRWLPVGNAEVMYLRPGFLGLVYTYALLRSLDGNTVLYLNSFCARRFSMLPVLMRYFDHCRPRCIVLAPRGEFSPGAMGLKRLRKLVYLRIARWLGLYKNVLWHASSRFEAIDIVRNLRASPDVDIAPVLSHTSPIRLRQFDSELAIASDLFGQIVLPSISKRPKESGRLRAVSVSRLSRMKNTKGALSLLRGVTGEVSFDIYGPMEDLNYWEECQQVIAGLPKNIKVHYCGEVNHAEISRVFFEHDLLLLPTLGENFGHVIVEALASGCPVLISDRTPWRNLEAAGVGWDIPLNETNTFRTILQQCVDGDDEWYAALSARAVSYATKRNDAEPEVVEANRSLFQRAINWKKEYRSDITM